MYVHMSKQDWNVIKLIEPQTLKLKLLIFTKLLKHGNNDDVYIMLTLTLSSS